jgi:SAM-dependent methyltransferase
MDELGALREGLRSLRRLNENELRSLVAELDTPAPPFFPAEPPGQRDQEQQHELEAQIDALGPWAQGPFYLGGDVVVGGTQHDDQRWATLREVIGDLSGKRVLDVGCLAGYDAFMFHLLGAEEVFACDSHGVIAQARFLESIYRTGVRFEQADWEQLDRADIGRFHLVHCGGLLHRQRSPIRLLRRLHALVADRGELLIGSMMLAADELSEYARFVPGDYAGDSTWQWVPGRLVLRWMLEVAGFEAETDLAVREGPRGLFPVVSAYVRGRPAAPLPHLGVD